MNIHYSIIKIIANRVSPGGSILVSWLNLVTSIPSQHLQEDSGKSYLQKVK